MVRVQPNRMAQARSIARPFGTSDPIDARAPRGADPTWPPPDRGSGTLSCRPTTSSPSGPGPSTGDAGAGRNSIHLGRLGTRPVVAKRRNAVETWPARPPGNPNRSPPPRTQRGDRPARPRADQPRQAPSVVGPLQVLLRHASLAPRHRAPARRVRPPPARRRHPPHGHGPGPPPTSSATPGLPRGRRLYLRIPLRAQASLARRRPRPPRRHPPEHTRRHRLTRGSIQKQVDACIRVYSLHQLIGECCYVIIECAV